MSEDKSQISCNTYKSVPLFLEFASFIGFCFFKKFIKVSKDHFM